MDRAGCAFEFPVDYFYRRINTMNHAVLPGDSIFDNARYVPDKPPVVEQLEEKLPPSI